MATTNFIKDPVVLRNLKHIAYISGTLSSVIGILGFIVAFSKSKILVTITIITTSICLVTLVSLAAHAFTYLGYQVALIPTNKILHFMNRTWISHEGDNFQKTVSIYRVNCIVSVNNSTFNRQSAVECMDRNHIRFRYHHPVAVILILITSATWHELII